MEFLKNDMAEALRLTRQGRLKAAVAVLRGKQAYEPTTSPERRSGFQPVASSAGRLHDTLGKLGRVKFSPLLDGLPGLGPKQTLENQRGNSRFEARDFKNAAGSRKYKLYVPGCYKGEALPLVVMLHGCTQSPDDFAAGTRMNEIAEEQGFFVAYPAQAASANASRCWNWFKPGDQQRDQGEPSIIAGMTREIMNKFSVQPTRVFIAGLSAGGATAAIMGTAYPDLYAAIGVHSGLFCGAASDLASAMVAMRRGSTTPPSSDPVYDASSRTIPTIVFHGDRDLTVNIANAAQVIVKAKGAAQLRTRIINGNSASGMAYTRTIQSAGDEQPVLEEWVLHGAGHAWSGGSKAGTFTEQGGPDASREMVRFFLQQ